MKKIICLILIATVITCVGCKKDVVQDPANKNNSGENNISSNKTTYWTKYKVDERSKELPDFEQLPEGAVEYDDEETFKVFYNTALISRPHFSFDLKFEKIEAIYEGDITDDMYKNACEWMATLYEAEKSGSAAMMQNNMRHRFPLLTPKMQEHVENDFIMQHTAAMYKESDIKSCSLMYLGMDNNKYDFEGYKTTYTDFSGERYYGITAYLCFDYLKYQADRCVPYYVSSNDMNWGFYCEVIFDENGKIAGWQERYKKKSESNSNSYYIISPEGIHNGPVNSYFEVTLDDNVKARTEITGFKPEQQMFDFVKELILTLKNNTSFTADTFSNLSEKCDTRLINSFGMTDYFNTFLQDIKDYNVKFEFAPKTLTALEDWSKTAVYKYENSKYGDLYCIGFSGHVKTGSQAFNDKYGLIEDRKAFNGQFYFTCDNSEAKFIGVVLDNYETVDLYDPDGKILDLIWQGKEIPIEEDQG